MDGHILVVGSLNMDLVVQAPRHPQVGETVLGGGFGTFPGGKGANQAVAAARLGGRVRMIGRVGADAFGRQLIDSAAAAGVEVEFIRQDPEEPTGVALITVDPRGRNTIVVAPGANGRLAPQQLEECAQAFEGLAVLVLQLETPLETVKAAARMARERGAKVVLNPAPAQPLDDELLADVDYLIPNESELALLSGRGDLASGVRVLLERGVRGLLVTLGEQGVLLAAEGGSRVIPAYKVEAVDTVAAGDAFVGAFAVGLVEGLAPEEAARLGNAAAAVSVTRRGAQPSLPTRAEVEEFLAGRREAAR